MTTTSSIFHGVFKLKTLCVGGDFGHPAQDSSARDFPGSVLAQTDDFSFFSERAYDRALELAARDADIDLVFLDPDHDPLAAVTVFITQLRAIRPDLPCVIFTHGADDTARALLRAGAVWQFSKQAPAEGPLVERVRRRVFAPVDWEAVAAQYAREAVRPLLEPRLTRTDLEFFRQNPEATAIVKRLFAGSQTIQILAMNPGALYAVTPVGEPTCILQLGSAARLALLPDVQKRLVTPRLSANIGQLQGEPVRGGYLAGACYTLPGLTQQPQTLAQYWEASDRMRREHVDQIVGQLRDALGQLHAGAAKTELRAWAPLYADVLPPRLTLVDALPVGAASVAADFVLTAEEMGSLTAVAKNPTLAAIDAAVRAGEQPMVLLRGFTVTESDSLRNVVSLQGAATTDRPLLRFQVQLRDAGPDLFAHPALRPGKRLAVYGRVQATQESMLALAIARAAGKDFDAAQDTLELAGARFVSPLATARHLLWEPEDGEIILPLPQVAPVIHGALTPGSLLIEQRDDTPLWLIDFSRARAGHTYADWAQLEIAFRTQVFRRMFGEMVSAGVWDAATATRFALLIEEALLQPDDGGFEALAARLRDCQAPWYDSLNAAFPHRFENALYFLYALRRAAAEKGAEMLRAHYPKALFFQATAALGQATRLEPWSDQLALCVLLTAGRHAIDDSRLSREVAVSLRERSAVALIAVGAGAERHYLVQWRPRARVFDLVGAGVSSAEGSFRRAVQRGLRRGLGLKSRVDYRITAELPPLVGRHFERDGGVFNDFEFRLFRVELLPEHPQTMAQFAALSANYVAQQDFALVTPSEVARLITSDGRPIADTARIVLQALGEIDMRGPGEGFAALALQLDTQDPAVTHTPVGITGRLINPRFSDQVRDVVLDLLPSAAVEGSGETAVTHIDQLDPGDQHAFELKLRLAPHAHAAAIVLRATYADVRGQQHRQLFEQRLQRRPGASVALHFNNPYVVGKPLTAASEALYVGRDDVFAWVAENLLGKTQPNALILHGQRRMGKTSTLYQLVNGHRGHALREDPRQRLIPVFVDLQRLAGCRTGELLRQLSQLIVRWLARSGINVESPAAWPDGAQGYQAFDAFLDRVEGTLPADDLLVLVMDELEQLQESIARGFLEPEILSYLRSLMQHRPRLTFILSGTNQLLEDYWSIIFHVGISREIGALSRAETEQLIRAPVQGEVQYEDLAVEQLWLAARGHPYFTQLLCHRLISALNQAARESGTITLVDVRMAIEQTIEEDDSHLLHLWNESTPGEQLVLAALSGPGALAEKQISRAEVVSRLRDAPIADESIRAALKRLEARRLVRRESIEREIQVQVPRTDGWQPGLVTPDHAYAVSFDLLRRWVARKRPLGSLLRVL